MFKSIKRRFFVFLVKKLEKNIFNGIDITTYTAGEGTSRPSNVLEGISVADSPHHHHFYSDFGTFSERHSGRWLIETWEAGDQNTEVDDTEVISSIENLNLVYKGYDTVFGECERCGEFYVVDRTQEDDGFIECVKCNNEITVCNTLQHTTISKF